MIDITSISQVLLKDAGYSVRLVAINRTSIVCFEDNILIGFCVVLEKPVDLINNWKFYESEILARFSPSFRRAGDKAWNIYCMFLSGSPSTDSEKRQISWIEENLERTRKLAASGVSSREELVRTLLPVLPLQNQPVLTSANITERLSERVGDIAPRARQVALDESISVAEVVRLLGER